MFSKVMFQDFGISSGHEECAGHGLSRDSWGEPSTNPMGFLPNSPMNVGDGS